MKEVWKPVIGYESLYEISSEGRVKSMSRTFLDSMGRHCRREGRILKSNISKQTGYPYVNLFKDGESTHFFIHRLIAEAFIPNPEGLPCVNHIDQVRSNSVLSNLEWCDYSYNNSYGEAIKKRKETLRKNLEGKHRTIYQFSLDGELVNTFHCGVGQLEERVGYDISSCLTGESKTAHGFIYSYSPVFEYKEDAPKSHQKYVILVDKDGKEIKRYKSVSEAGRENGFNRHALSRNKPANGIIEIKGLRFVVEKKDNEYIPKGHKGPRPDLIGNGAKPVCQYTKRGDFLREFPSVKAAGLFLGKENVSCDISRCCNGHLQSVYGYVWRFKE